MIFDAKVEVSCDREGCVECTFVDLEAGARNTYLADDSAIQRRLEHQEWVVRDGKHYCSEECAKEAQ